MNPRPTERAASNWNGSTPSAPAFTLIELMVVIVVVAILAAIAMPAIFRGRNAAIAASAKSRIRQHAVVFNAYANDSKGVLPYFADPSAAKTILTDQMSGRQFEIKYFNMMYAWPFVLAGPYYQRPVYDLVFIEPGLEHIEDRPLFSYLYPCSFVADSSYWNPRTRVESKAYWNANRVDHVRFPSGKSILVQALDPASRSVPKPNDPERPLLAFVDGSAAITGPEAVELQCRLGDGWFPDASAADGHNWYGIVGLHTLDGVEGRDRR